MKPITRKELYLNKIVGNNNYETPEKPITTEEFFFAEILGEAVQAPEPLTRYQMYLAKIAGKNVEIPYPETRLEYFLARAAGMDVETPTPITREEIFWSNYSAIVDFDVEGVPPLTYKAIEGTLENYRIYGNTVGGESVGDRTGNLCEGRITGANISSNGYISTDVQFDVGYAKINEGYTYTVNGYVVAFFTEKPKESERSYNNSRIVGAYPATFEAPISGYVAFRVDVGSELQCNEGNNLLPYEPYGYRVPVTISNGTDTLTTPIYLPEQIKKVGDEAELISYSEQKLHRIGADDIDVTLPELPMLAGTNTLTVGTAVQPSKVYVKYKGERQ